EKFRRLQKRFAVVAPGDEHSAILQHRAGCVCARLEHRGYSLERTKSVEDFDRVHGAFTAGAASDHYPPIAERYRTGAASGDHQISRWRPRIRNSGGKLRLKDNETKE